MVVHLSHPQEPRSHGGSLARSPGGALSRDVLFVTGGRERSSVGLRRAAVLAQMFGGELFVACAIPTSFRHNMLFPHRNAADSFAVPGALTGAQGRIRDFCDGVLGESLPEDHLIFEEGDVASVAARVAEELGAHIVVMGSAANGKIASEVACQARVPVFVARAPRAGTIVAATDLSDPRFPVLRRAGDLAGRSDRRTTIVHNVPPATGFDLYSMGVTPRFWPAEHEDADILSQYRRRLSALAGTLGIPAEPVVMTSASTSAAILEVGQETDADLLVVGAHPRSWLGRLLSPSVAETVVDRAARSVLVLPLSGEEHLAAATEPVPTAWAA